MDKSQIIHFLIYDEVSFNILNVSFNSQIVIISYVFQFVFIIHLFITRIFLLKTKSSYQYYCFSYLFCVIYPISYWFFFQVFIDDSDYILFNYILSHLFTISSWFSANCLFLIIKKMYKYWSPYLKVYFLYKPNPEIVFRYGI